VSHTTSVVTSKEAFNNNLVKMAADLQVQIDNAISPISLQQNA
jgi:hypothetical protein